MFDRLVDDVRTAKSTDPAARSTLAVLLTYPGLHAIWAHRVAHAAWERDHCLCARLIAHVARFLAGVEVHPGATLGEGVFVDHGMGTVIGETAVVGDDVTMYHGVTLGAKGDGRSVGHRSGTDDSPARTDDQRHPNDGQRHPTVEDGVELGARATVIGDVTVGEGATVGAGAVVVDDVPPGATVVGVPAEPLGEERDHPDAYSPEARLAAR